MSDGHRYLWLFYYPGAGEYIYAWARVNLDYAAVAVAATLLIVVNRVTVWWMRRERRRRG